MFIRLLIIVLIVLIGAAALSHLNPSTSKSVQPLVDGLSTIRSYMDDTSKNSGPPAPGGDNRDSGKTVYKWQDAQGAWQFSNSPPPKGTASSVKIYRTDNTTRFVTPKIPDTAPQPTAIPSGNIPLLPITNPTRIKQLMDDARNVQSLVDKRANIDQQMESSR
ncbi:MAG: hypothetical protein GXP17_01180 [Gammaproteobacteria bacterium]|nr:hypothetical protein [Gammaproteobacteria bacterium]